MQGRGSPIAILPAETSENPFSFRIALKYCGNTLAIPQILTPFGMKKILSFAVFALFGISFTGCETTQYPDPFDFNVILGSQLKGASVQVDIIGISEDQLETYVNKSITEYFKPDDPLRENAFKTSLNFRRDTAEAQTFPITDPMWEAWIEENNAQYIVFLADLPGLTKDQPGNADPRRLILPLDRSQWEKRPEIISVRITGESIVSDPAPLETY